MATGLIRFSYPNFMVKKKFSCDISILSWRSNAFRHYRFL